MTAVCMIYGATGYTGRLIVDAALARGLRPVIAGRDEGRVQALAEGHQLPYRVFSLEDPAAIAEALEDVDVVLNAAGPFSLTAQSLVQHCIAEKVHYLDICGEPDPLVRMAALDETARSAGVMLLPGVGFSPAVGEALGVHLTRRLPGTIRLVIALSTLVPPSSGLIRSYLEIARKPSRVLRWGRLKTARRRRVRRFDFGRGPVRCYALGWGELIATWRSAGVRNIDFFVQRRPDLAQLLRLPPLPAGWWQMTPLRRRVEAWTAAHGKGPSPELRRIARARLIGHAFDRHGQRAVTRIHLPDPYTVTAALAVMAMERVIANRDRAGLYTATQLLGADFLAQMPGLPVDWEELELSAPGEVRIRKRRQMAKVGKWLPIGRKASPSADGASRQVGQAGETDDASANRKESQGSLSSDPQLHPVDEKAMVPAASDGSQSGRDDPPEEGRGETRKAGRSAAG